MFCSTVMLRGVGQAEHGTQHRPSHRPDGGQINLSPECYSLALIDKIFNKEQIHLLYLATAMNSTHTLHRVSHRPLALFSPQLPGLINSCELIPT